MLEDVDPIMVALEGEGTTPEVASSNINAIFRLFHSLKGGADALKLEVIRDVTHKLESLLGDLREGRRTLVPRHVDLMGATCDLVRKLLAHASKTGDDRAYGDEVAALVDQLSMAESESPDSPGKGATTPPTLTGPAADSPVLAESLSELKIDLTPEMLQQFRDEALELVEETEHVLMAIESDGYDQEMIQQAFRAIHSFKGNAGFFGFADLARLSHKIETALGLLKSKEIPCGKPEISTILGSLDLVRKGLQCIDSEQNGKVNGLEAALGKLEALGKTSARSTEPPPPRVGEILLAQGLITPESLEDALALQNRIQTVGGGEALSKLEKPPDSVQKKAIRVSVEKLDYLVELVGEMVIAQANVANLSGLEKSKNEKFVREIDRLSKITKDLHRSTLALRMVPLSGLFRKMIRPVRDLARTLGKVVEVKFVGEETEVDKNVIELLGDPLLHIIRNAIDHGIEAPDERERNGKPREGLILIEGRHAGGEVWVVVSDNGRGLDRDKILEKARKMGLLPPDRVDVPDEEVFQYIFEPGFSTASVVSEVSGRGVGMDVVRRNVESLKGRVEVLSNPGLGAVFTIRLPLTLSIIDGMVIRLGNQRFVVPTQAITEFFRPTPGSVTGVTGQGELVSLRDRMIPFFRLGSILGVREFQPDPVSGNVMVLEEFGRPIGLLVDEILCQQQIVIKSLGPFQALSGCSGAAVMPDDRIALVLDPLGIYEMATSKLT